MNVSPIAQAMAAFDAAEIPQTPAFLDFQTAFGGSRTRDSILHLVRLIKRRRTWAEANASFKICYKSN
jgi:hypothetical protein